MRFGVVLAVSVVGAVNSLDLRGMSILPLVSSQATFCESVNSVLSESDAKWYAVFTMPRHEKRLVVHCDERKIECFLPLYPARHKWKNRTTATVELPLFPNYLFVRIDPVERLQVLKLPGVWSIVSSGARPLPIPDEYMKALRCGLLARRIEPHANVEAGDRVCITNGPMAGMEGILDRQKNELRVVLKLEMIGRSVAVEVGAEEIVYCAAAARLPGSVAWCDLAPAIARGLSC